MSDVILPHTLAIFAVGSTLVYCYDLRPIYDTKKYYVQEEWNATKSGHQDHARDMICAPGCASLKSTYDEMYHYYNI